ncbi:recombinase family protein [Streptomyces sp. NPDC007369]|uniref:recombinase family protein n=1 Tax=Streptomyces sp. NPDC007369 TaxID=3154589 RepID=UPI0033CFFBB3
MHEALDTTTPGGRLIFHVFAALAEFIRELIVAGTEEGLVAARARGKVGGRPTIVNEDLIGAARDMLPNPENSVTTISKVLGVSVGTLYNHVPDLKELRHSTDKQTDARQRHALAALLALWFKLILSCGSWCRDTSP